MKNSGDADESTKDTKSTQCNEGEALTSRGTASIRAKYIHPPVKYFNLKNLHIPATNRRER